MSIMAMRQTKKKRHLSSRSKVNFIKKATKALYVLVPEHVEHGCGDVVNIVKKAANRRKIFGIRIKYGYAEAKGYNRLVQHAWTKIDNKIFDPTWWVLGLKGKRYTEDIRVKQILGPCDPEDINEYSKYILEQVD